MHKKVLGSGRGYDLYAPYYKQDHSYLDSFDWPKARHLVVSKARGSILDIGCGDGRTFSRMPPGASKPVGLDISRGMLEILRKNRPESLLVQADAIYLPFKSASFDTVTAFFLLVHVQEPKYLFRGIHDILRKDGAFIANNIYQKDAPLLKAGKESFIIDSSYHSDQEIEHTAEKEGFVVEDKLECVEKLARISTVYLFRRF